MTRSPIRIFVFALVCTYAFFYEYLPPVRRVHIPYDLEGYHLPLADYAFQQLKQGRWPQWDPSIYSGMSFASNVQAALYYPGTWLMFLATWGRQRLSYQSFEDLDLLHVPLAFTLCFFWLRGRKLQDMAAVLGAAVFAFSGYLCVQLQHFGLTVAYTWMPLCLIGVDRAEQQKSWRPLWMVAVGSAMAFLGGYPPTWLVVAMAVGVYALASPARARVVPGVLAALVFSLALCAVQVLPTWDATHFREPELRYGIGIKDPMYFLSFIAPNYWDFGLDKDVMTNYGMEYLYLGAPGILGVLLAFRRWRAAIPAIAMIAAGLILVTNPYAIVWDSIKWSPLLADIMRSSYFMAGVIPGLALLAAMGLDSFLGGEGGVPKWVAMVGWGAYEWVRWSRGGFSAGPLSLIDAAVALAVFTLGLLAYRANRTVWMGAALLMFVGVDYKVFGTSLRQNATKGQGTIYSSTDLGAMNKGAYAATRSDPDTRILLHELGPQPSTLRHVQWKSPMGFDPFLSTSYRELIKRDGTWLDDRSLLLDPMKLDVMQRFGVRYVVTGEQGSKYAELVASPEYRMVGANDSYYKVFEYLGAKPIYQFPGTVEVQAREPEHRLLRVSSEQGGLLMWAEQGYPGWSATVDGREVPIEKWEIAFQAVRVPPGAHTVEFRYRERYLSAGLGVSVVSLLLLGVFLRLTAPSRSLLGADDARSSHA
ncbi:MAG: YfhO family protein [Bryobacteraceae bacterium]